MTNAESRAAFLARVGDGAELEASRRLVLEFAKTGKPMLMEEAARRAGVRLHSAYATGSHLRRAGLLVKVGVGETSTKTRAALLRAGARAFDFVLGLYSPPDPPTRHDLLVVVFEHACALRDEPRSLKRRAALARAVGAVERWDEERALERAESADPALIAPDEGKAV